MAAELFRALAALLEAPQAGLRSVADALELGTFPPASEHTELFSLQLVPYASIYLSNDGRIGGEAQDRIAGFWRALELAVPKDPDHLAVLLAFYAELVDLADGGAEGPGRAAATHRRRVFLAEHLLPWLPLYLFKLGAIAPPFYRRWAAILEEALAEQAGEIEATGVGLLHYRSAEPLPPPEECDLEELLAILVAPLRSGVILTRGDLAGAARTLGVAGRLGERRFMLESMLKQRPLEVISWLDGYLEGIGRSYSQIVRQGRLDLSHPAERVHGVREILRFAARSDS